MQAVICSRVLYAEMLVLGDGEYPVDLDQSYGKPKAKRWDCTLIFKFGNGILLYKTDT